ncbi:MLP-like protein 43 [Glycine soja]|nr:MLP-like protein 43 [Glycine soja]
MLFNIMSFAYFTFIARVGAKSKHRISKHQEYLHGGVVRVPMECIEGYDDAMTNLFHFLLLNFLIMSLAGKISIEIGVHASAAKWFNLFATQLHHVQNLTERVHETKLHHGDDWHHNESIKHWTCTIDGKVTTYHESIESVDEPNKTITYKIFGEDIDHQYKVFKVIFQAIHKDHGGAFIKWTIEYERVGEEVDLPFGFIEYLNKGSRDVDGHLLKA